MQQMTNHRPLAELDLLDDFLFNALLAYPEYGRRFCRKFLKILFGREFKNLNIVTQKSYGGRDTGLHGARLDVYIEEGDEVEIDSSNVSTIYDIEPDKNNKKEGYRFYRTENPVLPCDHRQSEFKKRSVIRQAEESLCYLYLSLRSIWG